MDDLAEKQQDEIKAILDRLSPEEARLALAVYYVGCSHGLQLAGQIREALR